MHIIPHPHFNWCWLLLFSSLNTILRFLVEVPLFHPKRRNNFGDTFIYMTVFIWEKSFCYRVTVLTTVDRGGLANNLVHIYLQRRCLSSDESSPAVSVGKICDAYLGRSWKASQFLLPPLCASVSGKFHPIIFIYLLVDLGYWHTEHVKGFLQVYIRYSFCLLCELFFIWRHSDPCNISTPSCANTRNTVFDIFKGVETITINHSKIWKWPTQVKDKVLDFPFSYAGENWELLVSIMFCLA